MKTLSLLVIICLLTSATSVNGQTTSIDDLPVITPSNVGQVVEVARLGRGIATHLDWHPNGEVVAFGGGWGIWLLDQEFNEIVHFSDIPTPQDIAWNPSENVLATLHYTEIRLWRVADDFSTAVLESTIPVTPAHMFYSSYPPRCLAWSADGQTLGVGAQPGYSIIEERMPPERASVEFYDVETETPLTVEDGALERQLVARCRYGTVSPDGQLQTYLEYGYQAGFHFVKIQFVTDDESEPVAEQVLGLSEVYAMDWHPSGAYITVIHQYNLKNFSWPDLERTDFDSFNGFISSLQWSPDGEKLLAGSQHTSAAYLWSRQAGAMEFEQIPLALVGDNYDYGGAFWSNSGGELIAYTAEYGYERRDFIDVETLQVTRRITRSPGPFNMSCEERWRVSWNSDYTRYAVYDAETAKIIVAEFPDEPVSLVWNTDVGRYFIGEYSPDGPPLPEMELPDIFPNFQSLRWQDDHLLITTGEDYASAITYQWDLNTETLTETAIERVIRPVEIERRDHLDDDTGEFTDQYILTITDPTTGNVISINPDQPTPRVYIEEGGYPRFAYSIHPDGHLLAIAVQGGLRFWSLEDGTLLSSVSTDSDIASLDWTPQGNLLAAGSMDGTVHLFSISSP